MKQLWKSVLTMVAVVIMALGLKAPQVQAEENAVVFPLPAGEKYYISVLDYYSSGKVHPSYIGEYIFKTGKSLPGCVMDIAADKGTPVYAVTDGVVYQNNKHKAGGYNVVLRHENEDGSYSYSYYGHLLARSELKKGTKVTAGQQIGQVGKSGSATGYHLHYEWSNHDVFCEFKNMGYDIHIMDNSGASKYPHVHEENTVNAPVNNNCYTGYVSGTDGLLAIRAKASSGSKMVGKAYECQPITVNKEMSTSKWLYVEANGVSGYVFYKYVSGNAPASWVGTIHNTDGSLAVRNAPSTGTRVAAIPEGATCTVYNIRKGSWVYVQYNGIFGWSSGKFIK